MHIAPIKRQVVDDYVSDRVYDGIRPVSPALLKALRDNHERTHGARLDRAKVNVRELVADWDAQDLSESLA